MIPKKTIFYQLFLFILCAQSFAQQLNNSPLVSQNILSAVDSTLACANEKNLTLEDSILVDQKMFALDMPVPFKDSLAYPPKFRDYRRLGYNTSIYIGAAVVGFAVLWSLPESVSNWDKKEMREKGILWKWKENVKAGPVWDKDKWVMNWVMHPYCGGIYYMTARSSGFTVLESFGYSAIMSTFFWEYGIESFAEVPSVQDLIITPVVGSVVGEGFFYAKKSIIKHDKKILQSRALGITTLFFMDPFNTILDGFGYKEKVKTQMNIAPVGVNQFSKTPVWGVQFSARF
jgi:hypothetical protein